jgi:hypothetical protein
MITEEQYKEARNIVKQYEKQLRLSDVSKRDFHIWNKVKCLNPRGIFFVHQVTKDELFLSNREWNNEKGIKRFWVNKEYCEVYNP